jgi:hypothetical protein
MNKTLMALLVAGAFGLSPLGAAATAQASAPDTVDAPLPDLRELNRQIDADYRAARTQCQSLARAERRDCIREARAVRQEARAEAHGNHPLAAIQTQSAEVTATGIAPSTGVPSPAPAAVPVNQ